MEAYSSLQLQTSQSALKGFNEVYTLFTHKITEFKNYDMARAFVALKLIEMPVAQLKTLQEGYLSGMSDRFTKVEFRKPSYAIIATLINHFIILNPSEKKGVRESNQQALNGRLTLFSSGKETSDKNPVRIEELTKLARILISADEFEIAAVVISGIRSPNVKKHLTDLFNTTNKQSLDFTAFVWQMRCATEEIDLATAKKFVGTKLKRLSRKELEEIKAQKGKEFHVTSDIDVCNIDLELEQWEFSQRPTTSYEELTLDLINEVMNKQEFEKILAHLKKGEKNSALNLVDTIKDNKLKIDTYLRIIAYYKKHNQINEAMDVCSRMPNSLVKNVTMQDLRHVSTDNKSSSEANF